MAKPAPSRVAAALNYLERLKNQTAEFGGGVVENLADRARSVGGLAYEGLLHRLYANSPTPRINQAAQDFGTIGRAIVTQPIQTGKAIVQGEIDRAQGATTSPRAAGEYAGSFIDPMRIAAALRRTAPVLELDVYHGTPHRFPATEANPLGEFDASKIGTGEGAQAFGHGVYLAETPEVAKSYKTAGVDKNDPAFVSTARQYAEDPLFGETLAEKLATLRRDPNDRFGQKAADYLEKNFDALRNQSGSLYKADLPDEMIDRMLDWDKPLSEQPDIYRKVLADKNWRKRLESRTDNQVGELTGAELYEMGHDQTKRLGIPGIKYLDAGSRDGGSGTRNFVVFPGEEKKVKILERK